ncbi:MAG TPA: hypothetical protein VF581_00685 [Flavobacterium sp.]|jgi:hypothetical protein
MKYLILILVFLTSSARSQQLVGGATVPFTADAFAGFDKFGFGYFITGNTLSKTDFKNSAQFQDVGLGRITKVDLVNPLRIVILYANFNTVVMLDNQLNEISRINFSDLEQPLVVSAIGNAAQNRLWIYDSLTQQIGLYDYLANNYSFLTQPLLGTIRYYESDFNIFQWVDEQQNRFSIDIFGKIEALGKVQEADLRFASELGVIYREGNFLYVNTQQNQRQMLTEIDSKTFRSFWYKDQILSIFTTEGITNYKIIIP